MFFCMTYVGAATAAAHMDNAASARPIIMLSSSSVENKCRSTDSEDVVIADLNMKCWYVRSCVVSHALTKLLQQELWYTIDEEFACFPCRQRTGLSSDCFVKRHVTNIH
jgi:hypothetical protein